MGGGEYIPTAESARKNRPIEIPESWTKTETQNEILENHETIKEEPTNEILKDDTQNLIDYQDEDPAHDDTLRELSHVAQILKRYPADQQTVFNDEYGILCIYLGPGSIDPGVSESAHHAKQELQDKFGPRFGEVFRGLRIYYTNGEIETAGWTYSGANVILMDINKNSMTLSAAEQLLGPHMLNILDEGDWLKVADSHRGAKTITGEITLVHEFAHLLQAKTHTKFSDTENAPTKYGRTKEWEDYAESFLYYCYDKPALGVRNAAIAQDIKKVISALPNST